MLPTAERPAPTKLPIMMVEFQKLKFTHEFRRISLYRTFKFCIMAKGKKTGGRQKGTPNKENPLKGYLRAHSLAYFEPKPQTEADGTPRKIDFTDKDGVILSSRILADADGNPLQMSDFDVDMMVLDANERVSAELRLLEFHTPKMKAVEVDMDVHSSVTIEDRLRELCGETDEDED